MPEASQLLDVLTGTSCNGLSSSESYRELELLLGKMACLKKDVMSPAGQVDATRFQAFDTNHDRVSVAELAGLCMSKNIPQRDLDIIFQTWKDRGSKLISRAAVDANVKEANVKQVDALFKKIWEDIYNIAQSQCIKTDLPKMNGGDVGAYEPENVKGARTYDYGLASGWNGSV
jgi:hypothetical protein